MIAVVAIIVVGPKDLPRMLRTLGKTMGQLRRTANDFKRQFDDALKEAEQQAGIDDTRQSLEGLGKIDPLADVEKELGSISNIGADIKTAVEKPADSGQAAKPDTKATPAASKTQAQENKPAAKPKASKAKSAKPKAGPAKPKAGPAKPRPAKPRPAKPAAKAQAPESGSDAA